MSSDDLDEPTMLFRRQDVTALLHQDAASRPSERDNELASPSLTPTGTPADKNLARDETTQTSLARRKARMQGRLRQRVRSISFVAAMLVGITMLVGIRLSVRAHRDQSSLIAAWTSDARAVRKVLNDQLSRAKAADPPFEAP